MVANAFAGLGFVPEAPTVTEFPTEMFVSDSDLTPLIENIDKVVYGLTSWQGKMKQHKIDKEEMLEVEGKDYGEALSRVNHLFLRNGWADGLPITAPTEERVAWILTGTDRDRNSVVGKILPQGRTATVGRLAVNLAMAGGRPEYLPVLIAAIEAIIDPKVIHQVFNTTTCSVHPAMIVNGPMAKEIRLNSGYGCLGPSARYPAGASLGRAVRLILLNLGGAVPGVGTMAIFGGSNRYANVVFAEDEEGLPEGWEPLNVSYFGYPRGSNTIAIHPVSSGSNVNDASVGVEETALATLRTFAGMMRVPNWNYWPSYTVKRLEGSPGILLMARGTAQGLAKFGWTRKKVQEFLWEHSKVPWSEIEGTCLTHSSLSRRIEANKPYLPIGHPWPITAKPENIMVVVAGGLQSGHGYWMQVGTSFKPMCKEVKLPSNWGKLLHDANEDLGPAPSWL